MNKTVLIALLACTGLVAACSRNASERKPEQGQNAPQGQMAPQAQTPPQGQLPPGHPPIAPQGGQGEMPQVTPPEPGSGVGATGISWKAPDGWTAEVPKSSMRRAQYKVPGPGGEGECVVYYFGPGQGGKVEDNVKNWIGQFEGTGGKPAPSNVSDVKAGDMPAKLVSVTGTFLGGMGMQQEGPKANYGLLGAIVEGPDANWFFKFTGPEATIKAQQSAFENMIKSVRKGS